MPEKIQKPGNNEQASNKTASTEKSSSPIPSISLPKGGGAIRGIDEKYPGTRHIERKALILTEF